MKIFFRFDKSPCNKRDNVENVAGHYQEIIPFRVNRTPMGQCPVGPDNDRRSIHYASLVHLNSSPVCVCVNTWVCTCVVTMTTHSLFDL